MNKLPLPKFQTCKTSNKHDYFEIYKKAFFFNIDAERILKSTKHDSSVFSVSEIYRS